MSVAAVIIKISTFFVLRIKMRFPMYLDAETAATQALLTEPSFQIDSLNFFLGREQTAPEGRAVFSLQNRKALF